VKQTPLPGLATLWADSGEPDLIEVKDRRFCLTNKRLAEKYHGAGRLGADLQPASIKSTLDGGQKIT